MAQPPEAPENFDRLLRLLALKRHEVPPPGYFDDLPREIRLELLAEIHSESSGLTADADGYNWLRRLIAMLERRPYLASVFFLTVCSLILTGVFYANNITPAPPAVAMDTLSPPAPLAVASANSSDVAWMPAGTGGSSTNPLPNAIKPAVLFDGSLFLPEKEAAHYNYNR